MSYKKQDPIRAYCVPCGKRTDHPRAEATDGCWCSECGCLKIVDVLLMVDKMYSPSEDPGDG